MSGGNISGGGGRFPGVNVLEAYKFEVPGSDL